MELTVPIRNDAPRIPRVRGLPLLGSALEFQRDPYAFFVRKHLELGPVFQFQLLSMKPVMLVGPEANRFWRTSERTHMGARPAFERLGRALGSKNFMMAMDGEQHARLRAIYQEGMNSKATAGYVPTFERFAREHLDAWAGEESVDVLKRLKRMVYAQLGAALSPLPADEEFDDVVRVFDTAVKIGVVRIWPSWMTKSPAVRASKQRLEALQARLLEAEGQGERPTFVSLVMKAVNEGVLVEDDLFASLLTPYFAGIDTVASTLAAGIYALLANPEAAEALREELDGVGDDALRDHRQLRKMKKLRAFVQETLRLYPIGVLTFRQATQDIEFEGYRIPEGTMMGFCPMVPHFMEEHFPDPLAFRLERWLDGRPCGPDSFYPFGAGAHVCLGAGLAEVQMLTTLAVLVRDYEIAFDDPGYRLHRSLDPLPAPKGLDVRCARRGG